MEWDWTVKRKYIDVALLIGIANIQIYLGGWISWIAIIWIIMAFCVLFQKNKN